MPEHRLDHLARGLARATSRRAVIRTVAVGLAALLLPRFGPSVAQAQVAAARCAGCKKRHCTTAGVCCDPLIEQPCGAECITLLLDCCRGKPTNTRTDPANCGKCRKACPARATCVDGACKCPDDDILLGKVCCPFERTCGTRRKQVCCREGLVCGRDARGRSVCCKGCGGGPKTQAACCARGQQCCPEGVCRPLGTCPNPARLDIYQTGGFYCTDRGTPLEVTVEALFGPVSSEVFVDYQTVTGNESAYCNYTAGVATPGSDYQSTSGTVSLAPGDDRVTFTIPTIPKTCGEPYEGFLIRATIRGNAEWSSAHETEVHRCLHIGACVDCE